MPELRDRIAHLIDELRRRGVLRVAAVYLIGAWLAIQVSDVTFPRLGMPDWTVTFIIVFLALMFPVAVGLAWVFDLTRTGVQRKAEPERIALVDGGAAPRVRTRVPVVLASLMAVPLIVFGLWWARDARASGLDPQLVAVIPFRIAGASPELAYLREGLMDLVAARISGTEGELRVVPPRTMSRRIRDDLGSLDADPDQEEALELASDLGAGRLLEGEVVGTGGMVTVTATLYDVATGRKLSSRTLTPMPSDSLHALVDEIAAQLIAVESGLRTDRLAAITTRSVPALRAFLDAEQAFRRGQHQVAVRGYDRAVQLDTTFALAALGLIRSRGWALDMDAETGGDQARRIVQGGIDRLGEADRAFVEVFVRQPGDTHLSRIQAALQAADRMPEQADLRYLAGDRLLHYGEAVGIADALEQGRRQLETVVQMDSTYAEPLIHLYELAISRADTAGMRRYGALLVAIDSTGPYATKVRYVRGAGVDGTRGAPRVDPDTLLIDNLGGLAQLGWNQPMPHDAADAVFRRYDDATLPEDIDRLGRRVEMMGVRGGQPSLVERVERQGAHPWQDVDRLMRALYWLRDVEVARAGVEAVRTRMATAAARVEPGAAPAGPVLVRQCLLGHFAVADGNVAEALSLAEELERAAPRVEDYWLGAELRACTLYLRAGAAVRGGRPDAVQQVEALDAFLAPGPSIDEFIAPVYALAVARLFELVGQPERAYAAVSRRMYTPFAGYWANELNGEQARVADALGRRDEAIRAYRAYLSYFRDPEPPFDERVRQAQARLAALVGERGETR